MHVTHARYSDPERYFDEIGKFEQYFLPVGRFHSRPCPALESFARGAKREQITRGAEELGIPLDEHIQNVLTSLQEAHEALGV